MKNGPSDAERQSLKEFSEFVQAEPAVPSARSDALILKKVSADLRPAQWRIFGKVAAVQTVAGVATLFVCPQFGFGFGGHNQYLHALHEAVDPFTFYLICGLLFIALGAVLCGLVLSLDEIRAIRRSKYLYYIAYAIVACLVFALVGADIVLLSASAWVLGTILGNTLGFGLVSRMRVAALTAG